MVDDAVLAERREHPGGDANDHGKHHGERAELERVGQALADQLGDGEVAIDVARAEITAKHVAEIAEILEVERLVEPIGAEHVRHDLRRQRPLEVERPAGGKAHQEEGDGDDDEDRRDRAQQPAEDEAWHPDFPDIGGRWPLSGARQRETIRVTCSG